LREADNLIESDKYYADRYYEILQILGL